MRTSNSAALSRYSFHNGSSFSTLPFKILFHISDGVTVVVGIGNGVTDGVVDIGNGEKMINVNRR